MIGVGQMTTDKEIFEEIVNIRQRGGKAVLATIVKTKGSTPRGEGTKMLVKSDGTIMGSMGGGCTEAEIWQEAMNVMKEEKPKLLHFDLTGREVADEGLICGGTLDVFVEPILAQHTVYIFGGGHISLFIALIARLVGFRVVVSDDRLSFANAERFPEADEIYAEDFSLVFPRLKVGPASYIVIVTRGHQHDAEILQWAVTTEARYIGMIGSKRKCKIIFSHLLSNGVPQEKLDRVCAPIGVEIGAETPEEIALSIVAEIVKARRIG